MKWSRTATRFFWCGMVALAFGQKDAIPPETFRLSYAAGEWTSFALSQDVVYQRDIKMAATENAAARDIKESQKIGFEVVLRSLSKNADGSREIEVVYRNKWLETRRDGGPATVADFSPALGKKFVFRLGPDGQISGMRGFESFPEIIDPASGRPIPNADFAHDILYVLPQLPTEPVSIGSTWEAPWPRLPDETGDPAPHRFQILGRTKKGGEDCLIIVSTYNENFSRERLSPNGEPVRIENASRGIEVFYFSLGKNMLVAKCHSWQGDMIARTAGQIAREIKTLAMYECSVTFD